VEETLRGAGRLHAASPVLRDILAADRTRLANERTLLSYIRTAIGLVAAGVGVVYLFPVRLSEVIGGASLAASIATLWVGIVRYRAVARDLAAFRADLGARSGGLIAQPPGGEGRPTG